MGREKLVVETKAEELLAEVARLLRSIRYPNNATGHLDKSANAVLFNIGEGIAVFRPKKKADKYDIARGEAREVQKALDALMIQKRLKEDDIAKAYDLADHIIAMLTNMIKTQERRA